MEKRDEALNEALVKNEDEKHRWELYKKENETAIENLDMFSKKLTIDVMVPIGTKALIPGVIHHTNEVFLSHFTGLFSNCSVYQAKDICKDRIKTAKEILEKLKQEQEMLLNKLNIPRKGVLPNQDEKEIIEEYDEEKEKIWREEHKKRIREHKQKEREETAYNKNEKSYEEVMKMLDDLELMEELDQELEQLEIEDDDTLQKLISGEINLPPEKKRISHCSTKSDVVIGDNINDNDEGEMKREKSEVEEIAEKYKNVNISKVDGKATMTDFTNNNSIPNSNDFHPSGSDSEEDLSNSDIPEEVLKIERETENMTKRQRLRIFKSKVKETEKLLQAIKIQTMDDLNHKSHLLEIRDFLMDYIEILKDDVDDVESAASEEENIKENMSNKKSLDNKKKKITFALEDQIKFIDNENLFIDKENHVNQKDVITLDLELDSKNYFKSEAIKENSNSEITVTDKRTSILEKVENSCNFIYENQSQQDFNLIDKILNKENQGRTLFIKFKHSDQVFHYPGYERDSSVPVSDDSVEVRIGSPADIYKIFSFGGITSSKLPETYNVKLENESFNKENITLNAYEDPRIKIFKDTPIEESKENLIEEQKSIPEKKSILKNKDAVKKEIHLKEQPNDKKIKKKKKSFVQENGGFEMIMGDVVEHPNTEPDPLPKEKFVDAHTPRKRISRFKQMRATKT